MRQSRNWEKVFHVKLEEILFETFCKSREEEAYESEGNCRIQHILSPIEKYKAQRVVTMVLNDLIIKAGLVEEYTNWRDDHEKY